MHIACAQLTFSSLVQSDVTQFLTHSTLLMWQCLASKIYRRLVRSNPFVCLTVRFLLSNSQHSEEMAAHYVISSCAALFVSQPNQETIQFLQRHTSRHQKLHCWQFKLLHFFVSSVRSSNSHPDLLLIHHHPTPTFSDHTGPQHWTFTF